MFFKYSLTYELVKKLSYRIFSIFAETKNLHDSVIQNYYNILTISRIMFYMNSIVNPILYHFYQKNLVAIYDKN
jgi:hypothetical protein